MSKEITIKEFDISRIQPSNTCIFIGKRGSGKTYLLRDLLYSVKDIPIGNIFSGTAKVTKNFDDIIPQHLIKEYYNPEILERIFQVQQAKIEKLHAGLESRIPDVLQRMDYIKQDINNYCFVVMDDTLSDSKSWKNDKQISKIFFEGRHYLIFFLLTMQIPLGIPPGLRSNIDFVFLTYTNNVGDIKKLYNNFGGPFHSEADFRAVFQASTEDYNCLVIDNVSKKNNIEERVFFYKAKPRTYRLCHPALWEKDAQKMRKEANKKKKVYNTKNTTYTISMEK
jgi:hypothetical protein